MTDITPQSKIVIIGIGNEYRNDDAIGIIVVRKLKELIKRNNVDIIETNSESISLIDIWKNADKVIIIDAVSSKQPPGKIYKIDAINQKIPSELFHYSSHTFNISSAIELAKALNQLPKQLFIYGIEGKSFEFGNEVCNEVQESAKKVIAMILKDIYCKRA